MAEHGVDAAREAFQRRNWIAARNGLRAAHSAGRLGADDLYVLAECCWWLGDLDTALAVMEEAHRASLDENRPAMAALVALNIGYTLATRGERAQAAGWLSRGRRLLAGVPDGSEHGYLNYIDHELALEAGDLDRAMHLAEQIQEAGSRHRDPTLAALGVLGRGQVLVKRGRVDEGMVLLDEAMVAAASDLLHPVWTGHIYCHLMASCHEFGDLRRAREWTAATTRWCERLPGAGPFMGICRVHRAQVLQVQAEWDLAEREVLRVCDELAHFDVPATAEAHYVLGDLRRQRGDLADAEAAYRTAHGLGRNPQPGWALLRLAEGDPNGATRSISAALVRAEDDRLARWRMLPAAVEIAVAAGDTDAARRACDELAALAESHDSSEFIAAARFARGTVLLADGDGAAALRELQSALGHWRDVGAWYEVARTQATVARAYDSVGDAEAAALSRAAAHAWLHGDGKPDRQRDASRSSPAGLTVREADVLKLVAGGLSNQQIAHQLVLSVRTVERHLSTIYRKLGVGGPSARAAAVRIAMHEGIAD